MSRTTITSSQLYGLLDREFRALKPVECASCRTPLPFSRKPPDDASANWDIGEPSECSKGCHRVIAELMMRLATRYDMEPERPQ